MSHDVLFDKFKELSHIKTDDIIAWFPNGKDCIRVRLTDLTDLMLTYHSDKDWRLETMDSYLNGIGK